MTSSGKQFKDIYGAGAKTLVDLQEQASKGFKEAREEHLQDMKTLAQKSSQSLQEKSASVQTELKQLMDESLERLENILLAENDSNQAFTLSSVAELQTRTDQMKSKLAALGLSHKENVDLAYNVACEGYLSNLETAKINLDDDVAQLTTGLNKYLNTAADNLLQTSEQMFWQEYEQSQETCDSFFALARQQETNVSDYISSLGQTLLTGCQNKLTATKRSASSASEEVESSIRSLLETMARHGSYVENQSKEKYVQLTERHFQRVDARLSDFADELSTLHDGINDQLLKLAEELSADLLSASTQAQDGLRDKCDQSVNSVSSAFVEFKQRLEKRLHISRGQKQALEDDKNKILMAIKSELLSMYDAFSKKIALLLADARPELADMTKSVETKIIAAMETCNEQVGTSATSVQEEIENAVTGFLQQLSDCSAAAMEEINSSAHNNLPMVSEPPRTTLLTIDANKKDIPASDQHGLNETQQSIDESEAAASSADYISGTAEQQTMATEGKTPRRNRRRKKEYSTEEGAKNPIEEDTGEDENATKS